MRQKGILTLTNPTSDVSFSITALRVYNIFASCQHCTPSASNPSTILQGSTATMVFTASSGYKMPSTAPAISTATVVSWTVSTTSTTDDTGTLILSNPTGDVSFTVTGEAVQTGYNITIDITLPSAEKVNISNNPQTWQAVWTGQESRIQATINTADYDITNTLGILIGIAAGGDEYPEGGTSYVSGGVHQNSTDWGLAGSHWYTISGDGSITVVITGWD